MNRKLGTLAAALPRDGKARIIPGAYDALSAKLIEEENFGLIYVGSYAAAAASYALPDVGVLTLDDMIRVSGAVVQSVSSPVVADAEGGFFGAPNIWRTVQAFERAGVAAIHIEDHAGGKHTNLPQRLISLDAMTGKLAASLDARQNPDFTIIARTDAIWAMGDYEEARRRLLAFSRVGVEHFFPTGATPEMLRQMRREVPGCYYAIAHDEVTSPAQWDGAADVVIDYGFCLRVVSRNLKAALADMRSGADSRRLLGHLEDVAAFEARLGYKNFTDRALRYAKNGEY